eukprot:COSAG02_NODE_621_length_19442_cov_39.261166_16_plen_108_part_00
MGSARGPRCVVRTGSGAVDGKSFKFTGLYFCVPLTRATMLPTGTVQTLSWSMSVTGAFCGKTSNNVMRSYVAGAIRHDGDSLSACENHRIYGWQRSWCSFGVQDHPQ